MGVIDKNLYVVILAGGKGKRLWPLTEGSVPKQFLDIVKEDTFLNHTIKRSLYLVKPENIYIVSIEKYLKQIELSLDNFKIPKENLLLEPEGKNTAPAALFAASFLYRKNPESLLLFCPCDHIITGMKRLTADIKSAVKVSKLGYLTAFGIKPSKPETEYGYIKGKVKVKERGLNSSFYKVDKFIEKPKKKLALKLIRDNNYFWSSGMFLFRNEVILEEFKAKLPVYYRQFMSIDKSRFGLRKVYREMDSISLEKLIIQKSKRLVLIKAGFKWQDLGQWDLLYDALRKDKDKNAIKGDVSFSDVKNCLVLSPRKKTVCLGLKDVVVIDTDAGLLVADKDHLSKLKSILNHPSGKA